jgi:hypothetical protein
LKEKIKILEQNCKDYLTYAVKKPIQNNQNEHLLSQKSETIQQLELELERIKKENFEVISSF